MNTVPTKVKMAQIAPDRLTYTQLGALIFAKDVAGDAERDLRTNAGDSRKARPTLAQVNRTLERLVSIQRLIGIALEKNEVVE